MYTSPVLSMPYTSSLTLLPPTHREHSEHSGQSERNTVSSFHTTFRKATTRGQETQKIRGMGIKISSDRAPSMYRVPSAPRDQSRRYTWHCLLVTWIETNVCSVCWTKASLLMNDDIRVLYTTKEAEEGVVVAMQARRCWGRCGWGARARGENGETRRDETRQRERERERNNEKEKGGLLEPSGKREGV